MKLNNMANSSSYSRDELVGKRFLLVSSPASPKPKLNKINDWQWKAGVIRCASHVNSKDHELQILVEFDYLEWEKREWLNVYKDNFHLLAVEDTLVLANRQNAPHSSQGNLHPALTFKPLVDTVGLWKGPKVGKPVEFVVDLKLDFQDCNKLKPIKYWDPTLPGLNVSSVSEKSVREWSEYQDCQQILITTPSVLLGFRLKVYRAEGTTQWYTVVTTGYNEATNEFTLTDDTVLEEHYEDPRLTQMKLLGDGVVESILRGDNVGIMPRRSRSAAAGSQVPALLQSSRSGSLKGPSGSPKSATSCTTKVKRAKQDKDADDSKSDNDKSDSSDNNGSSSSTRGGSTRGTRGRPAGLNKNSRASLVIKKSKALLKQKEGKKSLKGPSKLQKLKKSLQGGRHCLQKKSSKRIAAAALTASSTVVTAAAPLSAAAAASSSLSAKEASPGSRRQTPSILEESQQEAEEKAASRAAGAAESTATALGSSSSEAAGRPVKPIKREAVAIVRPQPQQVKQLTSADTAAAAGTAAAASTSAGSKSPTADSLTEEEREAGFSLYDFPSDSETEEKSQPRGTKKQQGQDLKANSPGSRGSSSSEYLTSLARRSPGSAGKVSKHNSKKQQLTVLRSSAGVLNPFQSGDSSVLKRVEKGRIEEEAGQKAEEGNKKGPEESEEAFTCPNRKTSPLPPRVPIRPPPPPQPKPAGPPATTSTRHADAPGNSSSCGAAAKMPEMADSSQQQQQQQRQLSPDSGLSAHRSEATETRSSDSRSSDDHHQLPPPQKQPTQSDQQQLSLTEPGLKARTGLSPLSAAGSVPHHQPMGDRTPQPPPSNHSQHQSSQHHQTHTAQQLHSHQQLGPGRAGGPPVSVPSSTHQQQQQHHQAAAAAVMSAHHLTALTAAQQYQAAAALQAASLNPAAHAQAAAASHLLAQYQQSLAAVSSLPPDVLLKQYPHLTGLSAANASHMMAAATPGRPPANAHNDLLMAREREYVAERERAHRERREAEQRERERQEKERLEKERRERLERERQERERQERERREREHREQMAKQLSAVEAVDHHFQLSMELAKKRMAASSGQPWAQLTGAKPAGHASSAEEEHRRARYEADRRVHEESARQYLNAMARAGAPQSHASSLMAAAAASNAPPPAHGGHAPRAANQQQSSKPVSSYYKHPQAKPDPGPPPPLLRNDGTPLAYQSATPPSSKASFPPVGFKPYESYSSSSTGQRRETHTRGPPSPQPPSHMRYGGGAYPTAYSAPPQSSARPVTATTTSGVYGKSSLPSRPESLPPAKSSVSPHLPPSSAPPPAHGGGGSSSARNDLRYLPPPPHAGTLARPGPQDRHPLPPPPATGHPHHAHSSLTHQAHQRQQGHSHQQPPAAHTGSHASVSAADVMMPLDLGAPMKRHAAPSDGPVSISPTKAIKLEDEKPPIVSSNGLLFKVSEPSVLVTSEPSTITTVENAALKVDPSSSSSSATETPAAGVKQEFGYVHKLKKAWIKAYSDMPSEDKSKMGNDSSSSTGATRATPSPALSNKSTASISSSTATNKGRGAGSGRGSKPGTPQPVNGHANRNEEDSESSDSGGSGGSASGASTSRSTRRSASASNSGNSRSGMQSGGRGSGKIVKRRARGSALTRGNSRRSTRTTTNHNSSNSRDPSDSDHSEDDSVDERSDGSNTTTSSRRSGRTAAPSNPSIPRRRGRRPASALSSNPIKGSKGSNHSSGKDNNEEEGHSPNGDHTSPTTNSKKDTANPFNNPPLSQLKKTGESFLQDDSCIKMAPKLAKCRECRWHQQAKPANIFCRFYGFRRLRYHPKNGQMAVAGFCDPHNQDDVKPEDAELWEASAENAPEGLTVDQATYLLQLLKYDFDLIVKEEKRAVNENVSIQDPATKVAWKRVVQGVREMCDVCDATLFNLHWACSRCGFVVCLDCYVARKKDKIDKAKTDSSVGQTSTKEEEQQDKFSWLLCTNRSQHDMDKLMLTQIVTGNALDALTEKLNKSSVNFKVPSLPNKMSNGGTKDQGGSGASLRDLIGSDSVKMADIIDVTVEDSMDESRVKSGTMKHYIRSTDLEEDKTYRWCHGFPPGIRSFCLQETRSLYPGVAHSWQCNGRVLRMEGTTESHAAVELFHETWRRGQPVVVSNATKALNLGKWYPLQLNEEFGEDKAEFVDVLSNQSLGRLPLKKFWDGYNSLNKRIKDAKGQPTVTRLQGWPGSYGEEFETTLPSRSAEFLRLLPLPVYTGRASPLNLAASLPDTFAKAEVGPRATITYGDISKPTKPSVNLHVEVADSLTVCVHAHVPKMTSDGDTDSFRARAVQAMEALGCDASALKKAREERMPAAVWTVFHPADADKIRDLFNREDADKGKPVPLNHDPILGGKVYLDESLIKKIKDDYNVRPFVITQFQGEAVIIPAGSPRQVKHLLSSISLSSDFVSPESVSHSFYLYRQLRHTSEDQSQPAEDRLYVKNLIFHSLKNALATLENRKNSDEPQQEQQQQEKQQQQSSNDSKSESDNNT